MKEKERIEWEDLSTENLSLSKARTVYVDTMSKWEKDLERKMEIFFRPIKEKYPEIVIPVEISEVMQIRTLAYCRCNHPILSFTTNTGDSTLIRLEDIDDLKDNRGILRLRVYSLCRMGIDKPHLGIHVHTVYHDRNLFIDYDKFLAFLDGLSFSYSEGKIKDENKE